MRCRYPSVPAIILGVSLTLLWTAGPAAAFDPAAGDFARESPDQIRVLSYNTQMNFIADSSADAEFERIIKAIHPDIISFQEIPAALSAAAIEARLELYFPGESWTVHLGVDLSGIRNVLAGRFPLSMPVTDTVPPSDARGVTATLVDLPPAMLGGWDLYVMAVHFKSGGTTTDHQRRQRHADAIVNWMRDARTPGGSINLPAGTPMLLAGDLNLGYLDQGDEVPYHAARTLQDGDIYDEATFGTDSAPDWDGTDSDDAAPYDHTNADAHTQSSQVADPLSRLDRFVFTDSVCHVANTFILNTRTLSAGALAAAGLQADDTATAADHLPIVVDLASGADPAPPGRLLINEWSYDDAGIDDHSFIEFRNLGGRELNLEAPVDYQLKYSSSPLPTAPPGAENEAGAFDLQGVVPPGGLFVLYDRAGESSGVTAVIEANLPRLQRQDLGTFVLPNGADTGIALVTVEAVDLLAKADTLVEAYAYADSSPGGSHYFRTDSQNGLVIELAGDQLSPLALTSDTLSFSRNRENTTANSFLGWTNPDTATPGAENTSGPRVIGWELY